MFLIECATGKKIEAIIETVNRNEFRSIEKSDRFGFDWNVEALNIVYKLRTIENNEILGIMSLIDFPDQYWVKINLLESSTENVGADKKYDRIAGCLIAYACRIAFKKNYNGAIGLFPKTRLKKHYMAKYGFSERGQYLESDGLNSIELTKEYL